MSLNPVNQKKKTSVLSIPSDTIHADSVFDFAVYYKSRESRYKRLLSPGSRCSGSIKRQLMERAIEKLYIRGEDKLKYLLYLKSVNDSNTKRPESRKRVKRPNGLNSTAKHLPAKLPEKKAKLLTETVRAETFFDDTIIKFPVYYAGRDKEIKKLLTKGSAFTRKTRELLAQQGIGMLHIRKEDMAAYKHYLQVNTPPFELDMTLPLEEKAQLLYTEATGVLEKLFCDPRCSWTFSRAKSILGHVVDVVSNDKGAIKAFTDVGRVEYDTHTHSFDVAVFTIGFGHHLGFKREDLLRVGYVGLFHDIGKSRIDPVILNKAGPLEAEEFAIVKKHANYSNYILKSHVEQDKDILNGVKHHHERFDGSGYPDNLTGNEIPLFAQVASIADVYDAVTSKKEYRDAQSSFETLSMMKNEMGHHFDKRLLMEFIKFMGPQYTA